MNLNINSVNKAGVLSSAALSDADSAGDSFEAASGLFVMVTATAQTTVTISRQADTHRALGLGALDIEDITVNVPENDTAFISIPSGYANGSNRIVLNYSSTTGVKVAAFGIATQ